MPVRLGTLEVLRARDGIRKLLSSVAAGVMRVGENRRVQYWLDEWGCVKKETLATRAQRICAGGHHSVHHLHESRGAVRVAQVQRDRHDRRVQRGRSSHLRRVAQSNE